MVVSRLLTTKFPLACFLMELALQLQSREADLELFWLPRLQNVEADALTNQCYTVPSIQQSAAGLTWPGLRALC